MFHSRKLRLRGPLFIAFAICAVGCAGDPFESQPCPQVSFGNANVYAAGAELEFGTELEGELSKRESTGFTLFAAHPVAVPPGGAVTLSVSADMDDHQQRTVVYLYGPREANGVFGGCGAEGQEVEGAGASLSFAVPAGEGGEYLVLVGSNPIADGAGGYTVTVNCEGEACGDPTCRPLLVQECPAETCSAGFATLTSPNGLRCPTCGCAQQACTGNRVLVVDQCVCDCDVPSTPQHVCGANGKSYPSACFAGCAEVPVARDGKCGDVCPSVATCGLDCEKGLKVVDGCQTCECAGVCDNVSTQYLPVCGTDGLQYSNAERMACETAAAGQAVGVRALGPCLPFCKLEGTCELSCPFGLIPAAQPSDCYECRCMEAAAEAPDGTQCDPTDALPWCGRVKPDPDETGSPQNKPYAQLLTEHRTFKSSCVAKVEGWTPILGGPCPAGVCQDVGDCVRAKDALATTVAVAQDVTGGAGPINAPELSCAKPHYSGVPVCATPRAPECEPGNDAPCFLGAKCVGTGEPGVGRCTWECPCLNKGAGRVYDPVCVEHEGQPVTLFNPCMAFCLEKYPVLYPGTCCDGPRLTVQQRAARFMAVKSYCGGLDGVWLPRFDMDTACPPSLEDCAVDEELCCRKAAVQPTSSE